MPRSGIPYINKHAVEALAESRRLADELNAAGGSVKARKSDPLKHHLQRSAHGVVDAIAAIVDGGRKQEGRAERLASAIARVAELEVWVAIAFHQGNLTRDRRKQLLEHCTRLSELLQSQLKQVARR